MENERGCRRVQEGAYIAGRKEEIDSVVFLPTHTYIDRDEESIVGSVLASWSVSSPGNQSHQRHGQKHS